jgi:spoIIIJ-associated protein
MTIEEIDMVEEEHDEQLVEGDDVTTVDTDDDVREVPAEFAEIARKYKAQESLTDDELDRIADVSIELLRSMLAFFGAEAADIDEYDGGEGELILDVSNADLAILIGRHGKTLEAFQYMFTVLLNNRLGFRYPVVVDIEGYKNRRRQKLESMAHAAANKALSRGCEVRMHPMKPYERRIVHLTLRNVEGIGTRSEGTEPNRYVVVLPKKGNR